jgi:hypothetical protein
MSTTHQNEPATSSLSADEVLDHVRRLYTRLRRLPGELGTNQQSAAYAALEAEIRMWADRYSKISGTSA